MDDFDVQESTAFTGDIFSMNTCVILKNTYFFLLPVELFISLNCFGVSCLVLEISATEISALSLI